MANVQRILSIMGTTRSSLGERGFMVQYANKKEPSFLSQSAACVDCPQKVFDYYAAELEHTHQRFVNQGDYVATQNERVKQLERDLNDASVACVKLQDKNARLEVAMSAVKETRSAQAFLLSDLTDI